jgi:WD40 repeat protein
VLLAHHWSGGEEHAFQLWSFGDHGAVRRSTPVPVTADTPVAAVSPDNRLLAAGSREEGGVTLWDLRDPMKPVRRGSIELLLKTEPFNTGQAWFAGDRTLATNEDGRHLRFWDFSDPAPSAMRNHRGSAEGRPPGYDGRSTRRRNPCET